MDITNPTTTCTFCYTTLWNINASKTNYDKLQGSVAAYLRCGGVVNNQIKKGLLLSLRVKKNLKSVNIWQSYKQERDCLIDFVLTRCAKCMIQPQTCL